MSTYNDDTLVRCSVCEHKIPVKEAQCSAFSAFCKDCISRIDLDEIFNDYLGEAMNMFEQREYKGAIGVSAAIKMHATATMLIALRILLIGSPQENEEMALLNAITEYITGRAFTEPADGMGPVMSFEISKTLSIKRKGK